MYKLELYTKYISTDLEKMKIMTLDKEDDNEIKVSK